MDISELAHENRREIFSRVMGAARELGFSGFGGSCWSAAVAINRLLLSSRGKYTMGVNAALHAANFPLGHVAVTVEDGEGGRVHLDADGRLKSDDEIESWGMLDPQDSDWRERAEELGVEWSEEAACDAALIEVSEERLLECATPGLLEEQLRILGQALARVQPSVSASSSLGMG